MFLEKKRFLCIITSILLLIILCGCNNQTDINGKTELDISTTINNNSGDPILDIWTIKYIFDYDGYSQIDVSEDEEYDDYIIFDSDNTYKLDLYDNEYIGYWIYDESKAVYFLTTENEEFVMSMSEDTENIYLLYEENYLITFERKPSTD